MCNGDDHGPVDRRTMPDVAISAKFAFAAASFCGGSGRAFARISWPLVLIVCRTPCLGRLTLKFGTVTDGNSANNFANGDGLVAAANASPVIWDLRLVRCNGVEFISSRCTSCLFLKSTRRELWVRKSATDEWPSYVRYQELPLIYPGVDMQSQFFFPVASYPRTVHCYQLSL